MNEIYILPSEIYLKLKAERCHMKMKNLRKKLKIIGATILLLLITALFFPTWTSAIKGEKSISVLEQVDINGSRHQIMIRGNDSDHPVIIFVHEDQDVQRFLTPLSTKTYWKPVLPLLITTKEQAENPIIFLRTTLIFHPTYWWKTYWRSPITFQNVLARRRSS